MAHSVPHSTLSHKGVGAWRHIAARANHLCRMAIFMHAAYQSMFRATQCRCSSGTWCTACPAGDSEPPDLHAAHQPSHMSCLQQESDFEASVSGNNTHV